MGLFSPDFSCVPGDVSAAVGAEALYNLVIPDDVVADLYVTTGLEGTAGTDTIIYLRAECADGGSELACNDDAQPPELWSDFNARDLSGGTYTLFVEAYGGVSAGTLPHELRITARPVLPVGAACDDDEVENRCQAIGCSGGTCP